MRHRTEWECLSGGYSAGAELRWRRLLEIIRSQARTRSGVGTHSFDQMDVDIERARSVALDITLSSRTTYGAIADIESRADFFGAMRQATGAVWFGVAENTSRTQLQGPEYDVGSTLTGWRQHCHSRGSEPPRLINGVMQPVSKSWIVDMTISWRHVHSLGSI